MKRRNSKRFILSELSDLNNNANENNRLNSFTSFRSPVTENIPSIHILHFHEDEDDDDRGIELEVEALTNTYNVINDVVGHDKSLLSSFDYMDFPPSQTEIQQWNSVKSLRPGMR